MGQKKLAAKSDEIIQKTEEQVHVGIAKKSIKKQVINGVAHISVSYNNTMITIADSRGEVVSWSSSGLLGFKGAKKSTPYAANLVAKDCIEKAKKYNLTNIGIIVKGVGPGREAAMRGLAASGLNVTYIMDNTPVPHNGVRPKKPRRV